MIYLTVDSIELLTVKSAMYTNNTFFKKIAFSLFLFCLILGTFVPLTLSAQTVDQATQRAQWEADLKSTEADIAKWQTILDSSKKNTASLQNEANILTAKINQAKSYIKQKNIAIAQLDQDISVKNATIMTLEDKIQNSKDSIGQLIRKTSELDRYSLAETFLSKSSLSEFLSDVDSFSTINKSLEGLLFDIRQTKDLTQKQKDLLSAQKDKETDLKVAQENQKAQVQKDQQQKEYLIKVNKTQEKTYAQVIAEQQAKAAQIRAKLFNLAGGSVAIPFGTALSYAQVASVKTGVDPAFVLAILTQESNLGANVGKCYLTDATTGVGIGVSSGKVWPNLMKPSRDVQPFLDITKNLGFDAFKTVVSCPIPSAGGYGGAMGPAQFIASTWALFEDRLQGALGHFANPWNAQDAFVASAMYLTDLGATGTSYSGQIRAACKYYGSGGSTCSYGRSVMKLRDSIQSDIDYLNQYGISRR
jgi:membrane-bound lytic murein transglycosylase B